MKHQPCWLLFSFLIIHCGNSFSQESCLRQYPGLVPGSARIVSSFFSDREGFISLLDDRTGKSPSCAAGFTLSGDTLWTRTLSTLPADEQISNAVSSGNGLLYMCGFSEVQHAFRSFVRCINFSGRILSEKYRESTGESLKYSRITRNAETGILAAGILKSGPGQHKNYLSGECFDSLMQSRWIKTCRVRLCELNDAAVLPDGGFLLTGYMLDFGDTAGSMFVMKWSSSGDSLWTRKYFGDGWATGFNIILRDNYILIAGATSLSSMASSRLVLVRLDLEGKVEDFNSLVTGFQNEKITDAIPAGPDTLLLCIRQSGNLRLILCNDTGNIFRNRNFSDDPFTAESVTVTPAGGFLISGSSQSTGTAQPALLFTDHEGMVSEAMTRIMNRGIRFYPNPSGGNSEVQPFELINFRIADFTGRNVYRESHATGCIDTGFLLPGSYRVSALSKNGIPLHGMLLVAP